MEEFDIDSSVESLMSGESGDEADFNSDIPSDSDSDNQSQSEAVSESSENRKSTQKSDSEPSASDSEEESSLDDDDDIDLERFEELKRLDYEESILEALNQEEETSFRGKFQCKLCPEKVFLNEIDLENHLKTKYHKKAERQYKKGQELARLRKEAQLRGVSVETLKKQRLEAKKAKKQGKEGENMAEKAGEAIKNKASKKTEIGKQLRKQYVESLTPEQIEAKKKKFAEKKARRLLRNKARQNFSDSEDEK